MTAVSSGGQFETRVVSKVVVIAVVFPSALALGAR